MAGTGQSIDVTWTDNSNQGDATATDKLVLAVYEKTTKTMVYSLNAGTRSEAAANLVVPSFLSGLKVQVWATFASADDKMYATSQYLGAVVIA
jgi:hypothetical protein